MTVRRAASFDPVMAEADRPSECERMTLLCAAKLDAVITPDEQRQLDAHARDCPTCHETLLAMTASETPSDLAALIDHKDLAMFANYVGAKTQKRRKWVTALISASVFVHVALVAMLLIRSFWIIDMLTPPDRDIVLTTAPPVLPPPKAKPPKPKPVEIEKKIVKVKPKVVTQPVEMDPHEPDDVMVVVDDSCDDCIDGGDPNDNPIGFDTDIPKKLPGGPITVEPPKMPTVIKKKVTIAPHKALEARRIAGHSQIVPDDATKLQIRRDGKTQISASVKMCLSATGMVTQTQFVRSSGYRSYDRRIASAMQQWRYDPFLVNGQPVPVCTAVTFVYRQID